MQQPTNNMASGPGMQPPAKSGSSNVVIIVIVVAVVVVLMVLGGVGVLAAMGIFGTRKYLAAAKEAEGRNEVHMIARDAVACSERETATGTRELPPTAQPVPASLSQVSGKKYMSSPTDWSGPGWRELKFDISTPQYFQYQWERTSATSGVARATCDLDGDGKADVTFEVPVTCTTSPSLTCTSASTIKEIR